MKLLRKSSIVLAGIILLLHTWLPHEHHTEIADGLHVGEQSKAENFVELLLWSFHLDQGPDHLEDYQLESEEDVVDDQRTFASDDTIHSVFTTRVPEEAQKVSLSTAHWPKSNHFFTSVLFRGPPIIA